MNSDKIGFQKWTLILVMFYAVICLNSIAYSESNITVTLSGSGTGTVKSSDNLINCGMDCQEIYQENKKVTLKASAGENSYFAGWSGDPCSGVTKPNCSFTADNSKNISAIFELNPILTLMKSGNGKGSIKSSTAGIDCGPDCSGGSAQFGYKKKINLKAKVDSYSTFLGWDGFECSGITKPQCSILMDKNKNVTARLGLPDISISPSLPTYDFKDVKLKQSSPPASYTIVNDGTGNLKITKIEILGTDSKLFKISGGGQKTIGPGAQDGFSIIFSPTSIGSKTATLRITSNDPDESIIEIALTGNGTDSILTASNAPIAASAVIQTFNLLGLATDLTSLSSIGNFLGNIKKSTFNQGVSPLIYNNGNISLPSMMCEEGGTVTLSITWNGPEIPTDPSQIIDLTIKMTFDSCSQFGCTMNGKVEIIFAGPLSEPTGITISVPEFAYANTSTGDDITITNLTITITGFTMDTVDHLLSGTITISGTLSGMLGGSPINVECKDFKIDFNSSSSGTAITIMGEIKASCLGDSVTINTTIPIFIPIGDSCPTGGEIVVTSGGNNVKVIISSDYKIEVYYNDTLIETYNNCQEVIGLCCN